MSEELFFYSLQAIVIAVVLVAACLDLLQQLRAGRGGITMQVKRSDTSLGYFYTTFGLLSALLAAICLTIGIAFQYRVLWALFDTALATSIAGVMRVPAPALLIVALLFAALLAWSAAVVGGEIRRLVLATRAPD